MRLIFAGTPQFAQVALTRLMAQGHEVVLVLTQPDRPAGRGLRLQASDVKLAALAHHLPVLQPAGLRLDGKYAADAAQAREALHHAVNVLGAKAMIVAAYGLILPPWVLTLPPLGCINLHASLLPRWRGAAPIHRAIEAGDTQSGVTIMHMDEGLDTGAIFTAQALAIGPHETTGSLHDQLATLGADLCHEVLVSLDQGRAHSTPQPGEGITYAAKISKAESQINWQESAHSIARKIRAFNPSPGAWSLLGSQVVKLWHAQAVDNDKATAATSRPGMIEDVQPDGLLIRTGNGQLRITELQRAGSKRMPLVQVLRGHPIRVGDCFSSTESHPSSFSYSKPHCL